MPAERHEHAQSWRVVRSGVERVAELSRLGGVAGEVALLPVVAVLRDIVHNEPRSVLEQVFRQGRVEVDRARNRGVPELVAAERAVGAADDRRGGHDGVSARGDSLRG
jgi:hypothetical protein